ncbi:MAG: polysaccharide pyruvyl transferase family protein, partial [Clostridia bacterium]|nr:polysaccharide pyruvyl transferase family protein [Clostridia bacterium]
MNSILEKTNLYCTGCGACDNICPANAISMLPDDEGFLQPQVNQELCIKCGKCEEVCCVYNNFENYNKKVPEVFAAIASEEDRRISSSGGVFPVLAKEFIRKGGIVYGAAMVENLHVCHKSAESEDELHALLKSKYVQSKIGKIYKDVKEKLSDGRIVLFSGTPCQIAGLKAYLGGQQSNLYTVDLLCHGVPSQKMLQQDLEEQFGEGRVESFDFRPVKNDSYTSKVCFKDGSSRMLTLDENFYKQAFHANLSLRDSCYECKFCEFPRQADLSLGDFWQVHEYSEVLGKEKGVSIILVNSDKGREMIAAVKKEFIEFVPVPMSAISKNRSQAHCEAHKNRDYFRTLYKTQPFQKAVRYALQDKYDIGLVGNWSYPNYGSHLTYYALYQVLRSLNQTILLISWPKNSEWKPYEKPALFQEMPYSQHSIAALVDRRCDMRRFNAQCETFILGSDQLLNNNLYKWFNKFQQLDWVYNNKRKIAYAASFGADYTWGTAEERAEMAHFMQQFDAFSVREDSGVLLAEKELGVEAIQVLDPVFLADVEIYHELADKSQKEKIEGSYVFCYTLDYTADKEEVINRISKKLSLAKHVAVDAAKEIEHGEWQQEILRGISVERWLAEIRGSQLVVTDSFHGMCFAIIFGIPFIALCNEERGATRFYSLLKKLKLENRLVSNVKELIEKEDILLNPIDFVSVRERLEILRTESLEWLKKALELPIDRKVLTDYDILSREGRNAEDCLNGRMDWAIGQIDRNKEEINGRMDWAIGRIDQDKE